MCGAYFLFIGGSSTQLMQKPVGRALAAFLMTLIFIVVLLLSGAGDGMCQRDERRIESPLVTRRHVHVAKLTVRGRDASAGTHGFFGDVADFFHGLVGMDFLAG
jgi:hypothetical protein